MSQPNFGYVLSGTREPIKYRYFIGQFHKICGERTQICIVLLYPTPKFYTMPFHSQSTSLIETVKEEDESAASAAPSSMLLYDEVDRLERRRDSSPQPNTSFKGLYTLI